MRTRDAKEVHRAEAEGSSATEASFHFCSIADIEPKEGDPGSTAPPELGRRAGEPAGDLLVIVAKDVLQGEVLATCKIRRP